MYKENEKMRKTTFNKFSIMPLVRFEKKNVLLGVFFFLTVFKMTPYDAVVPLNTEWSKYK